MEKIDNEITSVDGRNKEKIDLAITLANVSLDFLNNFDNAYRLWFFTTKSWSKVYQEGTIYIHCP